MAFKTKRNFVHSFRFGYQDETGKHQEELVTATFKTMPRNEFIEKITAEVEAGASADQATLNIVLVSLEGLGIEDDNGPIESGSDAYLTAVKQDPALSLRLNEEYSKGLSGNCRPAT